MELRRRDVSSNFREAAASVVASLEYEPEKKAKEHMMYLSTGSTLLNLALSDKHDGGWLMGRFVNLIGDSSSGKTFLALTTLAEAAHNDKFKDYRLIFDDVEAANTFDIQNLFGSLADRMEAPRYSEEDDLPLYSNTIEDWYANIMRVIREGKPFVYVLDSVDALTSKEEIDRAEEYVEAQDKDKDIKGSYKVGKAKLLSEILRVVTSEMANTNSLIIAISQTRDNIDPMTSRFNPKVRAGGRALKFYATHELWVKHLANIENTKYKRKTGDRSEIHVSKNKVTGKARKVPITLYYSYGIDDIDENINFLMEMNIIKKVTAQSIDVSAVVGEPRTGTRANVITYFETDKEACAKLSAKVGEVWNDIENQIKVDRPKKYE